MAKSPQQSFVPVSLDIALYSGDGARMKITVKNPAGVAVPLTGTVAAQIRADRQDPSAKATWTVDLTNAATGIVLISLSGTQTAALMNGSELFKGFWDVQWTPTGSEPLTILQGKATCALDVTRP
jgi:hypothetical protein